MLTHALLLVALGVLFGATRDVRGSISPTQIRAAIKRVGVVAAVALTLTALLGTAALVVAWSLRPATFLADAALVVMSAVASRLASLLESPHYAEIGA
jgi:hypothetical protein